MAEPTDMDAEAAEAALLARARTGDEGAFGDLVRLHHERVFRRIVAIVRNEHDANDVSQEMWVSVWRSLQDYRGDAKFSTWLYAVATRRAIDHLRRRRRWIGRFLPFLGEGAAEPVEFAAPGDDPRGTVERSERDGRFERALAALPPKHRSVLALREVEGLSYEAIAETLNCRPGTVMSRLFKARRLLAQKLENMPCE